MMLFLPSQWVIIIILCMLWLIFGSFGSVLITRSSWKSIVFWRSACPKCHTQLKRYQLIPLLSFIYQKGKCSHCKQSISWKYFILELWSAILFTATYLFLQYHGIEEWTSYLFWIAINRLLFLLILFDIERLELHVPLWGILLLIVMWFQIMIIKWVLIAMLIFWWSFYLLYFIAKYYVRKKYQSTHGWIWEGDALLAWVIWALIPAIAMVYNIRISWLYIRENFVLFLILSSVLWLIFSVLQMIFHKGVQQKIGSQQRMLVPFIPAMIVAVRVLLVFVPRLILFVFPT